MDEILRLFPKPLKASIQSHLQARWHELQEIRLRLNQHIEFNLQSKSEWLAGERLTKADSQYVLNQLSEHSLYRFEDELREGYITIKGGHRVGIAGEVSTAKGKVSQLHYITFFNIRIAREVKRIANQFVESLIENKRILNTLIIGKPQTGKTTIIRDLARIISEGTNYLIHQKVAIIDERSEIAASINGVPQHYVGKRTDVMDACPKVEGMMMMIRSMSPEVIIVDEVGKKEDVSALLEAIYAGVTIISTVHGESIENVRSRPSTKSLFDEQIFTRFILLSKTENHRFSIEVLDSRGISLQHILVDSC